MKKILIIFLIIAVSLSGCNILKQDKPDDIIQEPNVNSDDTDTVEKEIVLYFANSQAQFVVPEKRSVKVEKDMDDIALARIILEELINGPKEENLYKTIPSEVKILNIEIQEDTILIDFSKEMHTKHWGGAAGEDMTICSLANTMTEMNGINNVMPSVEGMALNIEHIVVDEPLERMEDRIYR